MINKLRLIKPEVSKVEFIKWYFARSSFKLTMLFSVGLLLLGCFFNILSYILHGVWLLDVLIIFSSIGIICMIFLLASPFIAFKQNANREVMFSQGIKIFQNDVLVSDYKTSDIKIVHFIINEVIIFNFKNLKSISIYSPSSNEINYIKNELKNSGVRLFEARSLMDIMLRKHKVFSL
ncbi:MAG: hypothetical protein JNM93_00215 [Bacteriovoracaceae bacterium]|nr:hypothetical protein [Bacteriovoracaceae bacterium]